MCDKAHLRSEQPKDFSALIRKMEQATMSPLTKERLDQIVSKPATVALPLTVSSAVEAGERVPPARKVIPWLTPVVRRVDVDRSILNGPCSPKKLWISVETQTNTTELVNDEPIRDVSRVCIQLRGVFMQLFRHAKHQISDRIHDLDTHSTGLALKVDDVVVALSATHESIVQLLSEAEKCTASSSSIILDAHNKHQEIARALHQLSEEKRQLLTLKHDASQKQALLAKCSKEALLLDRETTWNDVENRKYPCEDLELEKFIHHAGEFEEYVLQQCDEFKELIARSYNFS